MSVVIAVLPACGIVMTLRRCSAGIGAYASRREWTSRLMEPRLVGTPQHAYFDFNCRFFQVNTFGR